jgi:hypothetical protein
VTKSYFFYGVVEGEVKEDTWHALHAHFEKLAREDDVRDTQVVVTERKARRNVEQDGL